MNKAMMKKFDGLQVISYEIGEINGIKTHMFKLGSLNWGRIFTGNYNIIDPSYIEKIFTKREYRKQCDLLEVLQNLPRCDKE